MNFKHLFFGSICCFMFACSKPLDSAKIINLEAEVPQRFHLQNLRMITSSLDPEKKTMSILYGNVQTFNRVRKVSNITENEELILVTWLQNKLLPIEYAKDIYLSAAKKPFVSLYSTASWHEDLAEYLSVTHLTRKLKQPFRILIYEGDKEIFSYEPMTSSMVNSRTDFMKYFYRRKVGT